MKFLKAFIGIVLTAVSVATPFLLYSRLTVDEIADVIYSNRESEYYGSLNIWQIDCFEGGTGSRANWLNSICSGFEKKHNGVYVYAESVSLELANKMLASGQKKPDIISFGMGTVLTADCFETLTADLGTVAENVRAVCLEQCVPWCMGGYFVIGDGGEELWGRDGVAASGKKREVYSLGIGEKEDYGYKNALLSFTDAELTGELSAVYNTPGEIFDMYNYSQRIKRIVGTQRDLYRLASADKRGSARAGEITFINTYDDLFQYIGILKCGDEKKVRMLNRFIEYLLSEGVQSRLGSIGLFPVNDKAEPEYGNIYVATAWETVKMYDFECQTNIFCG